MDNIRTSFSNLKKDLKHRLGRKKRAPDRTGDEVAGERVDSSASLLRPDPHVAASGRNGEASRIVTDVSQTRSMDPPPQPKSMPAGEGRNDLQKEEVDVDEKGGSPDHSRLDPGAEVAPRSGPSREEERGYYGAWSLSPQLPCLIPPETTQTPPSFLIMRREIFVPTRTPSQVPPRTRRSRAGSLLPLPLLGCSSGG